MEGATYCTVEEKVLARKRERGGMRRCIHEGKWEVKTEQRNISELKNCRSHSGRKSVGLEERGGM